MGRRWQRGTNHVLSRHPGAPIGQGHRTLRGA
jgi:hypothetical protein